MLNSPEHQLLEREVEAILADPAFARAPIMSRLLRYLLEMTLAGRSATLKAYTVATVGLGKNEGNTSDIESYARVQLGRLRKAIAAYYASRGASREHRVLLEPASYELKLTGPSGQAPAESGAPDADPPAISPRWRSDWKIWLVCWSLGSFAAAVAAILLLGGVHMQTNDWKSDDFPVVKVGWHPDSGRSVESGDEVQTLIEDLHEYPSLKIVGSAAGNADYLLYLRKEKGDSDAALGITLSDFHTRKILWTENLTGFSDANKDGALSAIAFEIANNSGVIHGEERQSERTLNSAYSCWLLFSRLRQSSTTLGHDELIDCAVKWHSAQHGNALADGAYVWTLADQSVMSLSENGRRMLIDQALETSSRARSLNPRSAPLLISATRAYALAGRRRETIETAREAAKYAPVISMSWQLPGCT